LPLSEVETFLEICSKSLDPTVQYLRNEALLYFRRDTAMAGLLTAIVIVFLSCHCPKVAVNLYEAIEVNKNVYMGLEYEMNINLKRNFSKPAELKL
jgi:hypothetical protein